MDKDDPRLKNLRPRPPWKPGQSGNPAGSSRKRRITDVLIKLLDEKCADRALAKTWLTEALKGDPRFFAMLLDRVEGKVPENKDPDDMSNTSDDELIERAREALGGAGEEGGSCGDRQSTA